MSATGGEGGVEQFRRDPVLVLAGALDRDRHELLACMRVPRWLSRIAALLGASRWQIESRLTIALRAQCAVEQIAHALALATTAFGSFVPAEVTRQQLVGLQHAHALD